ncbi:sugar transferase [Wenxinia marina]|uniref:Sugar transferase involved in lipopolysaccharide synthesis n=1 Tax=Wenxinia marina DSM 24838 TaxID=1123501 RepID=A0A0D0Q4G3_9RHOB|nr:sugar transferase [Wenxinia marina]KIQ67452.1 Sugar transferase involved in lipopolysaccharide synthesis [Wenxinia marina DSM 24838]GGL69413.1 hypothetical protein GCM10011392_24840 [Wenxinia marina]
MRTTIRGGDDETAGLLASALGDRGATVDRRPEDGPLRVACGDRPAITLITLPRAPGDIVRHLEAGHILVAPLHAGPPVAGVWRPRLSAGSLASRLLDGSAEGALADDPSGSRLYRVGARALDLCFVVAVAVLLGWTFPLIALWIRLDSPGSAIFAQTRVGRHGRPFTCLKFRSMRAGTRQAGTHEVSADAVTRPGRLLRRLKLDELPQAWNVLMGDLALVGPRPCLPVQKDLIARRRERGVLSIRPGITGLAQVAGIDMSDPERLARIDAAYAAMRSLSLDLALAWRTVRGGGRGDRVDRGSAR